MLVQITEDDLEGVMDLWLRCEGECLNLAAGMSKPRALFPELPKLLGGDVGVNCPAEVELASGNLGIWDHGGDSRPDWPLEINRYHRRESLG